MRAGALTALALMLAACGSGASDSAPASERHAAGTLPPPPPADAAPDNRFPLPYPQAPVPSYAVGQDVEIISGSKWSAAKVVEVTDVDGEQVVRTSWPGGTSELPYLISNKKNDIRLPTGRLGNDLLIGRYTCYDGGTDRPDLSFRVAKYGKYTDPYGEHAGTFATSGDTISFAGGKFDGVTAQQLLNNQFYFTPQFTCRWHAEGL